MRLTVFTDNALRCLIALGLEPDHSTTIGEVATRMGMSEEHLVKVVQRLAHLGLVRSTRGRGGGIRLAVAPAAINLGALVRETEENMVLVECFSAERNGCPISPACGLAGVLDQALRAFLDVLDRHTLADVLGSHRRQQQVLQLLRVAG
jgi:Rrf2 family nitric oxide-sensitive transcriptional repressor